MSKAKTLEYYSVRVQLVSIKKRWFGWQEKVIGKNSFVAGVEEAANVFKECFDVLKKHGKTMKEDGSLE